MPLADTIEDVTAPEDFDQWAAKVAQVLEGAARWLPGGGTGPRGQDSFDAFEEILGEAEAAWEERDAGGMQNAWKRLVVLSEGAGRFAGQAERTTEPDGRFPQRRVSQLIHNLTSTSERPGPGQSPPRP